MPSELDQHVLFSMVQYFECTAFIIGFHDNLEEFGFDGPVDGDFVDEIAIGRNGGSSSGRAKRGNFLVTLGASNWAQDSTGHNVGSRRQQAGTIMHELGHTLGLGHGGGDGTNCKPNYLSVMNYSFQTRLIPNPTLPQRRLDYSRQALPDLNEDALDENLGIQDGTDNSFFGNDGTNRIQIPGSGPVDWNSAGGIAPPTIPADISFTPTTACTASPGEQLRGFNLDPAVGRACRM
jgi:hypothetical protein